MWLEEKKKLELEEAQLREASERKKKEEEEIKMKKKMEKLKNMQGYLLKQGLFSISFVHSL